MSRRRGEKEKGGKKGGEKKRKKRIVKSRDAQYALCATWRGRSDAVNICVPIHVALKAAVTVPNISRT